MAKNLKTPKSNRPNSVEIDRAFTLSLAGIEWNIYFVNGPTLMHISGGRTSMGLCDRGSHRIFIRKGLTYSRAMRILVHESTHAVFSFVCGCNEGENGAINEETACNLVEQVYADLREQEPLFRKSMLKNCEAEETKLLISFANPEDMEGM